MNAQTSFFNRVAEQWESLCNHDMTKVNTLLDAMKIQPGQRVLDVGTGCGVLIPMLAERITSQGSVLAVDLAVKMIEKAQRTHHYPNIRFACSDALQLCDREMIGFDHIICYSMFPHFDNQFDAIHRLSRALKDGGRLSIAHSQSRSAINSLHKDVDSAVEKDRLPPMETLCRYATDSGLVSIDQLDNDEMFLLVLEKRPGC